LCRAAEYSVPKEKYTKLGIKDLINYDEMLHFLLVGEPRRKSNGLVAELNIK